MRNDQRIVVIADDITGAAEIAGLAKAMGQSVSLLCATASPLPSAAVTVIATDTRSMTEAEAVAETRRIAASLPSPADSLAEHAAAFLLFKKPDPAIRGHVVAELKALLNATGLRRCVYVPANPSKGRIIRNGIYYIRQKQDDSRESDGRHQKSDDCREPHYVPISETAFSYDPEFPARTSVMRDRFPDADAAAIVMPDAETAHDLRRIVSHYDDATTLFAGAADLFEAFLAAASPVASPLTPASEVTSFSVSSDGVAAPPALPRSALIICGSTQSHPLDTGALLCPMPREVYDGDEGAAFWFSKLHTSLARQDSDAPLALTIPFTHRTGKAVAIHLRTVMAQMARRLVEHRRPSQLIIEGGATAWAVLHALGWNTFSIERQIAPGVVQMRANNGTLVTLKPGSYPWF